VATKIRDRKPQASTEARDILRLEITVMDAQGMAELDRLEELKKYMLDQVIAAKIATLV
jgi:hypothetical protein